MRRPAFSSVTAIVRVPPSVVSSCGLASALEPPESLPQPAMAAASRRVIGASALMTWRMTQVRCRRVVAVREPPSAGATGAPEGRGRDGEQHRRDQGGLPGLLQGQGRGRVDAFAEDAVWQGADSTELPGGGEHRGRDAIVQAMESIGIEWDSFELTPDEFFEDGDTVIVLGHSEVSKGGSSGKIPVVHVARFENGKVKRFQALTDTLLVAQLLGLIGGKPPDGDRQEAEEKSGKDGDDSR